MWRKNLQFFINTVLVIVVFTSCQTTQLYEQVTTYPDHKWASHVSNQYQFAITDTAAAYKVYFVI